MKAIINKIYHEPLLHFLLLGALVYIYYTLQIPSVQSSPQKSKIVLTQSQAELIKQNFEKTYHIKASQAITEILIEDIYMQQAMIQEAYRLQLYKNDAKIEKILLQKMHYILQKEQSLQDIDEKKLYQYYKKNKDAYGLRKSISFYYIKVQNRDREEVEKLYNLLKFHKPLKNLKKESQKSKKEIIKSYGNYFAKQIFNAPIQRWLPPIATQDGFILPYIYKTTISSAPSSFEEVEERVYRDYKFAIQKENYLTQYKKLHQRYILYKEN